MVEEFKKSYKNGYEVMLKPEERDQLVEYINKLERANNIINELEKYLDEDDWTSVNGVIATHLIKNKLQELKGVDKE